MDRVGDQNPLWNVPLRPPVEDKKTQKKTSAGKSESFSKALETQAQRQTWEALGLGAFDGQEITEELLGQMMDQVKEAGDALVKNPSPGAMMLYKERIGVLIQGVIAGSLEVRQTQGRLKPSTGTRPKYTQVHVINEKLDKLGAFILQDQKDKLEILRRVEELKGLLVNFLS